MAKEDDGPPPFPKVGDDPKLDKLIAKLRSESNENDPFYVDFKKPGRWSAKGKASWHARLRKGVPAWSWLVALGLIAPAVTLTIAALRPVVVVPEAKQSIATPEPSVTQVAPTSADVVPPAAPTAVMGAAAPAVEVDAGAPPSGPVVPIRKARPWPRKAEAVDAGAAEAPIPPQFVQ